MLKFFFKKSFFDGWDNMFSLAAFNGALLALAALGLWLPSLSGSAAIRLAGLALTVVAAAVWSCVSALALYKVAEGRVLGLDDVRRAVRDGLVPGLQYGAMVTLAVAAASAALPFYASLGGALGVFATGLSFWLFAALWLTLQYFPAVKAAEGKPFVDTLRLSFIAFVDAPGFAAILALDGLLCVALSPVVAFLLPGFSGAALASCEAYRLRRLKLRWLSGAGAKPGRAPWAELLAEDVETFGRRGFKDLLFPWKR
jgi:hypothetical protein